MYLLVTYGVPVFDNGENYDVFMINEALSSAMRKIGQRAEKAQ